MGGKKRKSSEGSGSGRLAAMSPLAWLAAAVAFHVEPLASRHAAAAPGSAAGALRASHPPIRAEAAEAAAGHGAPANGAHR